MLTRLIPFSSQHLQEPVAKRPQTLNFINGYAVPSETFRAAPAAVPESTPAPAPAPATGLPMSTLPKFLEFDRKVRDCRLRKHATRLSGPSTMSAAPERAHRVH